MSGPKSSRYTLTAEQREKLTIAALQRTLQGERSHLTALLAQVESEGLKYRALGNPAGEKAAVNCEQLIQRYAPLLKRGIPDTIKELRNEREWILRADREVRKETRGMSAERSSMEDSQRKQFAQDLRMGYDATLDSALEARKDQKRQRKQQIIEKLERAIAEAIQKETVAEADRLMRQYKDAGSDGFRETIFTVSIQPFLKQCQREKEQYLEEETIYQDLLSRYAELCKELSLQPLPHPWTPGVVQKLQAEVDDLEAQSLKCEEEVYIRQSLDEVMRELGYLLLGEREVTKRSGKRFHHMLYTFDDGTAIDVTYGDDGRIAMELGGLDDCDRIPDDRETVYLCDAMDDFCTSFAQIEERLKARGVVLRERIHMLPSSEENAQIINTSDYQLTTALTTLYVEHGKENHAPSKYNYKDDD